MSFGSPLPVLEACATGLFEILGVLSGADMGMMENAFASWLDAYGRAWESCNPQAAADLFAEDGTYQVTPCVEHLRGRQAIFEYWTQVTQPQQNI